jgi:hypothetical protein
MPTTIMIHHWHSTRTIRSSNIQTYYIQTRTGDLLYPNQDWRNRSHNTRRLGVAGCGRPGTPSPTVTGQLEIRLDNWEPDASGLSERPPYAATRTGARRGRRAAACGAADGARPGLQ